MKNSDRRRQHIAVLDADQAILAYIDDALSNRFKMSLYTQIEEFSRSLDEGEKPDLLMIDWLVSDDAAEKGLLQLLARIRACNPSLPIIVLACSADFKELLDVLRVGAVEILLKPFRKCDIDETVQHCLDKAAAKITSPEVREIPLDGNTSFVRSSRRMQEVESQCTLVARADIPVLILGESGTGKEVAAMLIHKMSTRNQQNFLKLNCAAMPADLLESELFGYEQGAFTGALKAKPGKFELCDKGTIFLDEIGEMPAALQAKLLQVLQDGSFSRLGGRSTVKVDVRVIAATNVNIKEAIARKAFREDLYYRLNGFTVKMPPLRERSEEIPVLAAYFMRKAITKHGCEPLPISPALMQALTRYPWPGNLRELENTIKRYLVLRDEIGVIEDLSLMQDNRSLLATSESVQGRTSLKVLVKNLKGNAEAAAIAQALEDCGWNRKIAASKLRISYKALLYKIKQYNLSQAIEQNAFSVHAASSRLLGADELRAGSAAMQSYGR